MNDEEISIYFERRANTFLKEYLDIKRVILKQNRFNTLCRQYWRCNICAIKLKFSINSLKEGEVAHIDHIHPFSKRWSYYKGFQYINEPDNLQALCPTCNFKKGKNIIH